MSPGLIPANSRVRVVHAHDQGYVVASLTRIGRLHKEMWVRVPPVYMGSTSLVALLASGGKVLQLYSYFYASAAELLARFMAWAIGGVLHIHGGHLHQFCRRTKVPFVLHIHGSEVRGFDSKGVPTVRISPETRAAILKSRAVAYSTPELGPILETVVDDAIWVPAPLKPKGMKSINRTYEFADVFFPHVWMEDKSLELLVTFIRQLKSAYPGPIKLVGLDIGDRKDVGLDLGFELLPVAKVSEHLKRMYNSKVVLAQPHGAAFGVSDLQAIAIGSNLTPFPLQSSALSAYGYLESNQPTKSISQTLGLALAYLEDPTSRPELGLEKILAKHSDDFVYRQLKLLYAQI